MTSNRLPDYNVHGAGDITVFLLHGAFGAKDYWQNQVISLVENGYRVVAWDAPGYGISPMPKDFSIESAAQACANLIDAVGGKTNVIMGHSMGGMIAQRAFSYRPDTGHGLILAATSAAVGGKGGDWQKAFVSERVAPLDAGKTIPEYAPQMLKRMMKPDASGPDIDLMIQVVSKMREETFRAAIEAITHFDGRDIISKMNIPVFCIAGEFDLSAAPPKVMEKMASRIPEAEFVCMQGVGHFGWAEDTASFNEHMIDFLERRIRREVK